MDKIFQNAQTWLKETKSHPGGEGEWGKVAVLLGGTSGEREISLQSGQNILAALQRQGVNAHSVALEKNIVHILKHHGFDRVFIALHGHEGENGVVQGALEMAGIPFTGSKVGACALAMDKVRAKLLMHALSLPTPLFGLATDLKQAHILASQIGFPLSVKPVSEGSSLGVSRIDEASALKEAFHQAASYGEVMIERWIEGKDFFVSIINDKVLPAVEVQVNDKFYDYQAKYESNETRYSCPTQLKAEQEQALREVAYQAYRALGCEGWGRVDLIQDKQNKFWVLEVNTVPGMTAHSLVPLSAQAVGISFDQLVMMILQTTLPKHGAFSQ